MSRSRFKRDRLSAGAYYLPYKLYIGEDDFIGLSNDGRGGVVADRNGDPITLDEAKKFFVDLGIRTSDEEAPIVGAAFTE